MADNTQLNTGTGGDLIATDELSTLNGAAAPAGLKVQRVKIGTGADGSLTDVSATNPLPISISNGAITTSVKDLATPPASTDNGVITQSILHGRTSAGGGAFVDVKVSPSGALIVDASGTPVPVTISGGEIIEALQAQRIALQALARTIGQSMPDVAGRLRVAIDSISASLTLATITTVGTVTTVSTLSNQTLMGGFSATEQIPSLMRLGADSLRRNISVS